MKRLNAATARGASTGIRAARHQLDDEYDRYRYSQPHIECGQFPIIWWRTIGSKQYPILVKMAIDHLSLPVMSDKPERFFSFLGQMITKCRNHLHPDVIQASGCLRSWDSAGIIDLKQAASFDTSDASDTSAE